VVSREAWPGQGNDARSASPPRTRCLLSARSADGSNDSPVGRGPSPPHGRVAESVWRNDSRCALGNLDCHQCGVEARAPRSVTRVIARQAAVEAWHSAEASIHARAGACMGGRILRGPPALAVSEFRADSRYARSDVEVRGQGTARGNSRL